MNRLESASGLLMRVCFASILVLLLSVGLASRTAADGVKYIYGTPRGLYFNSTGRAIGNMPWQILSLSDAKDSLEVEFSILPRGLEPFGQMYEYSDLDLFLVADGGGYPTSYRAISLSAQHVIADISVESVLSVWNQHLFTAGDSVEVLRLYSRDASKGNSLRIDNIPLSSAFDASKLNTNDLNVELGGCGPPYTSKSADVLALYLGSDSVFSCQDSTIGLAFPRISGDVIGTRSVHQFTLLGWKNLVGVILVVPNEYGSDWRELLILDRSTGSWNSVTIPGAQTTPRLVNGYLVATVADLNPKSTPQSTTLLPSVMRDEVVICDPLSRDVRTIRLGPECEVLWLRGDTITYRTQFTLKEGVIDELDNVTVLWSLEDIRVSNIHWAFWSSSKSR